jgi:LAO/AO transport system kinase
MARQIVEGDRRTLGRLISDVEEGRPEARRVLKELHPRTGNALVVGLSGPLGVGKSSLVNRLLQHLKGLGRKVGVIAVDPSSPFSGGAVLGDRVRIERDPSDPSVFFRSMASRGHPGGLSQSTREVIRLLEAFGMDTVLVETVGSGQVDVEIHSIASTRMVVLVPHLGDEVQTLKAGLFEIADIFVVNKSDLPGADRAARDLAELAQLSSPVDGWRPQVVQTSTLVPSGIGELWDAVMAHEQALRSGTQLKARLTERADQELRSLLLARVQDSLDHELRPSPAWETLVSGVVDRAFDPYTASEKAYRLLLRCL